MLIKNFVCAQLPFPFFFLPSSLSFSFFIPHLIPATAKESRGVLKLIGGYGRSLAAKQALVNFWAEGVLLIRAILVIITL